jgi:hypothetical protein
MTKAERQFTEDFQAYKSLFVLSGFKGKEKIIRWIRNHGPVVIKQAEVETEKYLRKQSLFELEELACIHEDHEDKDEDKE